MSASSWCATACGHAPASGSSCIGAVVFLFAYCVVVVKFGFTFTGRAWSTSEVSSAQTGLSHRWIIKAMLPIGFIILGASGLAAALRCIVYLFGPPELRDESSRYAGTHHADLPPDVRHPRPDHGLSEKIHDLHRALADLHVRGAWACCSSRAIPWPSSWAASASASPCSATFSAP